MPLSNLIAALSAATGPSRELDERMATEVFGLTDINEWWPLRKVKWFGKGDWCGPSPAYTSSLDAITGAIKARWPDAFIQSETGAGLGARGSAFIVPTDGYADAEAATEAMARCLAAARLAEAEEGR